MGPLAIALSEHIWYTTTNRNGKGPFLICKCTVHLADSNAHAEHVAKVAIAFMAAA